MTRTVLLAATATLALAACTPMQPCEDEACVANRMMLLGVMANMNAQQQANQAAVQQSLDRVIIRPTPTVEDETPEETPAQPAFVPPYVSMPQSSAPGAYSPGTVPGQLGTIGPYNQPADVGGPVTITDQNTGESVPAFRGPIDAGGHAVVAPLSGGMGVIGPGPGTLQMQDN